MDATGPIRLLTHLRYFGKSFNPVSFYYCFSADGSQVVAVVADVTNTPWGERHAYVMGVVDPSDHGTVTLMRARFDKQLHVSPLMGMDHTYDWRLTEPGQQLLVHIESDRKRTKVFDATLSLHRREMTPRCVASGSDPISPDHITDPDPDLFPCPPFEVAWSQLLPPPG